MPGQIVSHESYLRIDVDFISLEDCFKAFRRGIDYREQNDAEDILVICNTDDCVEYQTKNGDSFLLTYDPIHKVMVMRMFFEEGDKVLKPLYIYNQREYQIACEFVRRIMGDKMDLMEEWLS